MSLAARDGKGEGTFGLLLRLRGLGMLDERFLTAIERTPHEGFVAAEHARHAAAPGSLPLPCGQVSHGPDLAARLVDAARIDSGHSVLEIGTGSGYQTALLARFARKVHTVDRYRTLLAQAKARLARLHIENVTFEHGDGMQPAQPGALYDRIICDMAFTEMPRHLLDRLAAGGVVVTAIGEPRKQQVVVRLMKIGSRFEREDLFPVRLMPPESGTAKAL